MPTGMSWATYLKMFAASLLTMCAGTEVVHRYHQQDKFSEVKYLIQSHICDRF
uniref:Uncharacterized protein n=1 Tax=Canis lupus dingo TaxID=286419 RepID=A0A8C0L8M3_CANLU